MAVVLEQIVRSLEQFGLEDARMDAHLAIGVVIHGAVQASLGRRRKSNPGGRCVDGGDGVDGCHGVDVCDSVDGCHGVDVCDGVDGYHGVDVCNGVDGGDGGV